MKNFLVILAILTLISGTSRAQETVPANPQTPAAAAPAVFTAQARAADAGTLVSGTIKIHLWGIHAVEAAPAAFQLQARIALDNAMGARKVECEAKSRDGNDIYAQCVNADDLDLSLFMLQEGYVTADRASVYNTVFEDAYIQAETQAQNESVGIWNLNAPGAETAPDGSILLIFGFILFLCIIGAFTFLSITIMRGFRKIIDAQTDNADMLSRERKLRDKERGIVAVMLDSELKSNRAKIEAYLVVYEEMLRGLKDTAKTPKYKRAGDIVQKQPALDRAVFDRNTDKLDILGGRLSSALIHFYARIKSNPDYINIEPEIDVAEATAIVEKVLENARRMHKITEDLVQGFEESGVLEQKF